MRIDEVNRGINSEISTIYLPADPALNHISSTLIRETLKAGGNISGYVPKEIKDIIGEYYRKH
jgi:pantetheine-phosphate adenylyltransferase